MDDSPHLKEMRRLRRAPALRDTLRHAARPGAVVIMARITNQCLPMMDNEMDNFRVNIDHCNLVVLKLFEALYDSFPHPLDINPDEIDRMLSHAVPVPEKEYVNGKIGTAVNDVIVWLEKEEFLQFEPDPGHRPGYFRKTRLTMKGMTILGYPPDILEMAECAEPLIQRVKSAVSPPETVSPHEPRSHVVSEIFKLALARGLATH